MPNRGHRPGECAPPQRGVYAVWRVICLLKSAILGVLMLMEGFFMADEVGDVERWRAFLGGFGMSMEEWPPASGRFALLMATDRPGVRTVLPVQVLFDGTGAFTSLDRAR